MTTVAKAPLFVVLVDPAPEMEATVSAAFALAKHCGARVHLLEVLSARAPSLLTVGADAGPGSGMPSARDASRLSDAIDAAQRDGMHVRTATYRGDATKIIASYAQLTKATLLVAGHHHGTPRWRRNTRIVSTLSRAAPVPVLVMPPQRRPVNARPRAFGHVISAVDFTVASAVAVRTVLGLVRRTGARLTLVHALKNVPRHMVFSGGEALTLTRTLRARAAKVEEHLRRKVPASMNIRVDARVTTGDPYRGILDVASEVKGDLIVMGVAPRSRFHEVLFGSTLRSVLRRATIPVLVLPVPGGAYRWLEASAGRSAD